MKEQLKALRGTKDLLPKEARLWTILEEKARVVLNSFGYSEIRTPIIEESALFVKSLGQGTDIVEKQMFTFLDRGERSITLRPEATASVVRAYIENGLENEMGFAKLFYMGPMFRAERPQAGRMRQFHQIGVEAIGSYSPYLDAEVIALMASILDSFGITGYAIKLNSLGCEKDKKALREKLVNELGTRRSEFCEDCQNRLMNNTLRILDCKNEKCGNIIHKIFNEAQNCRCAECQTHFEIVKKTLDSSKINYILDPYLVRGLDYYTKTVFEVVHKKLGAQDAIGAGGRYDNLIADLGGPVKGACGFAIGMERAVMALQDIPELGGGLKIYIATMGEEAYKLGSSLAMALRGQGISAEIDFEGKSLKAQMRAADKLDAKYVAMIGGDEIKSHSITLRNMGTKEQSVIPERNFVAEMERMLVK